jgi:hypothetical protein
MDVKDHELYMARNQDVLLYADWLSDLEAVRIAQDNRIRSLLTETGLEEPPAEYVAIRDLLDKLERRLVRQLEKSVMQHPLGEFIVATPGIGKKQGGRLLASIGDPCWNAAEERPRRGPAEFWKYMGLAPGQRKKRGERAAWNHEGKMRSYLIAEQCMKTVGTERAARSPYRDLYEEARAHYEDAVHEEPCVRCGPSGKPAPAGSPLSDGHKHARALRKVQKTMLKDLFNERKRIAAAEGTTHEG